MLYNGPRVPDGGPTNWSSGFLPAVYQGTPFRPGPSPILHVERPDLIAAAGQRDSLDLLRRLNQLNAERHPEDTELLARANAYELAYRMESAAPEAVDLDRESAPTKKLYGLDDELTREYGTNLLRARRLVERGVRFVQVISGPLQILNDVVPDHNWDAHQGLDVNHKAHARTVDGPIAGLLTDLKARGLLDSTLIVWTSEFGRTPYGQSGNGRDHNPWGYTQWLAGGGSRAGATFGATDEIGLKSLGTKVDTYDLNATVLQLLGLDHLRTIYVNNGRSERPTVVYGEVIKDLLA